MNVLIYGGGAVGLGIASCLLKSGAQVTILARTETTAALQQEGLQRTGIFGTYTAKAGSFQAVTSLDDLSDTPFTHILVCTKSFDSQRAAADIREHAQLLREGGCIVLFQNGWGNAEIFSTSFPNEQVYNARVITGFIRPEPHHVDVTVHADAIHIGSLYRQDIDRIIPLAEAINDGDIPCVPHYSIEQDLWAKMLFNCPLNPLGAIFGVTYGTLGEHEHTRTIMEMIIREIFQVIKAGRYSTYWNTPEDYFVKFYTDLVPLTARHYSSTLQDLRAGKRTEIDALNGAIVELGKTYDIDVPANLLVYNMITFLETRGGISHE